MAKIIFPGVTKTYVNTCPHCYCVYEYSIEDIHTTYDYINKRYVVCPFCGHNNEIMPMIPYNDKYYKEKYKITFENHTTLDEED